MSHALSMDPDEVVGKLLRLWIWCDAQLADCNGDSVTSGVTKTVIDRITRVAGFAQVMSDVGWLVLNGDSVEIPNFWYHNGQTAKNRGLTNRRVAKSRAKSNANCNGASVTAPLQKPLPEKRREEKSNNTPKPPRGPGAPAVADPRHHAITSEIKERFRKTTGEELFFDTGRDVKRLAKFLGGWNGTVDAFWLVAEAAWRRRGEDFSRGLKHAGTLSGLIDNWGVITSELKPSEAAPSHLPPSKRY